MDISRVLDFRLAGYWNPQVGADQITHAEQPTQRQGC